MLNNNVLCCKLFFFSLQLTILLYCIFFSTDIITEIVWVDEGKIKKNCYNLFTDVIIITTNSVVFAWC